jgi:hypothetical protein
MRLKNVGCVIEPASIPTVGYDTTLPPSALQNNRECHTFIQNHSHRSGGSFEEDLSSVSYRRDVTETSTC